MPPPNHSKDDASQFFRRFATNVQGRRSSGEEPTAKKDTTNETKPKSLLTQVQQGAEPTGASPFRTKGAIGNANRLSEIKRQPTNMSPVDAARHPSLLPRSLYPERKCLVLDVDETLVHSSYQPVHRYDLHLPLKVNGAICNVYVAFRPGLKEFLRAVTGMFEVVIFTASVAVYCDPLMTFLDPDGALGNLRLFREHCSLVNGSYVKDLSLLGRDLNKVCIIDNSPVAYLFQPRNAIPILSWFDDPEDKELLNLLPLLRAMAQAPNVYETLDEYNCALQEAQAQADSAGPARR